MIGLQPFCRNGHPKDKSNTHQGRCRLCRKLNARRYRAEGTAWQTPPAKRKARYMKNRKESLAMARARYFANRDKIRAQRRINRLRNRDITPAEFDHLTELVREVSAMANVRDLTPRPKVRFCR